MIRIITVEREYGSGGADIAKGVANRLGWKLWDQLLTNEIARHMKCASRVVEEHEEKRDPLFHRLVHAFMRGSFEGSLNAPRLNVADTPRIREVAESVVKEAAKEGSAVIVGRGSAYYLADRPDAFHVFVFAPFEEKVRRIQAAGKSRSEAEQLVETVDQDRAAFIKHFFGVTWPDRQRFDLMVNSTMGEEVAINLVLNSIDWLDKRKARTAASTQMHRTM